jgi:hypothetical protein
MTAQDLVGSGVDGYGASLGGYAIQGYWCSTSVAVHQYAHQAVTNFFTTPFYRCVGEQISRWVARVGARGSGLDRASVPPNHSAELISDSCGVHGGRHSRVGSLSGCAQGSLRLGWLE